MTDRHVRVESLIRELAAKFIQHEANTDPMITVTGVKTSPDYRKVTVFFTTIPDNREEDAQVFLQRHGSELRRFVKKESNLKIIPHIEFAVDRGERHRQHIDQISSELKAAQNESEKGKE